MAGRGWAGLQKIRVPTLRIGQPIGVHKPLQRSADEKSQRKCVACMTGNPVYATARMVVREWRAADLAEFARMNADPQVMRYFPETLSREQSDAFAQRIAAHFAEHGFGLWVVEIVDVAAFAGFVGLTRPRFATRFTPCVEIGWRLARRYWRCGYATEAAQAVVRHGFTSLGLNEIVSFTVPENHASRRVMEKLGMHHNPAEDFDHPGLPTGHPLQRHVLYRLERSNWSAAGQMELSTCDPAVGSE